MKHTLKAKYAADGLNAHRQRVTARVPEQLRRQRIVDAVTARFNEPARPKIDADFITQVVISNLKRNLAKFYAQQAQQAQQIHAYGTRRHSDDLVDAIRYGSSFSYGAKALNPLDVIKISPC